MADLETQAYIDALVSHALTLGRFDQVNRHEPKSAPGYNLTGAVWFISIRPFRAESGLASTTVRLEMMFRIYTSMLREPADELDPELVAASDALINAYSQDFTLDGMINSVDLLGRAGDPLGAQSGYLPIDNKLMRIVDITIPMIINDIWDQVP